MKIKSYLLALGLAAFQIVSAQTGTDVSGSFTSGGVTRTYTIYIPKSYDSLKLKKVQVPLVINMHGATGTSAAQETAEDFRKIADTANFIIIHPQGLKYDLIPGFSASAETGWNVLSTVTAFDTTDRNFIVNLLDTVERHYNVNPSRVYLTGYSEGAFMCYEFACFVSSRIAAIASVCGSLAPSHFSACNPTQPTPVMEIHGTKDQVIAYAGNGLTASTDVDTMMNYWIRYNHCNMVPDSVVHLPDVVDSCCVAPMDSSKVVHYVYTGGTKGATVELYKVLGGGHQIPSSPPVPTGYGTGNLNEDFTAAVQIWRFFSKYNLTSLGVTPIVDTTTSTNPATGISEVVDNNSISIYPNPSNGSFTLYVENNENTSVQIINLLGTVIFEENIYGKYTPINIGNESKGIYFYKVKSKTGIIKSGKLIIQ